MSNLVVVLILPPGKTTVSGDIPLRVEKLSYEPDGWYGADTTE